MQFFKVAWNVGSRIASTRNNLSPTPLSQPITGDAKRCFFFRYDLPEEECFRRLGTKGKYLIDTIKMIAYRAETAMVSSARELMSRMEDARSLIQAIYKRK